MQTTISVWTRGRLRELAGGILSGLPDGMGPVLRSGILSPAGIARAALDLVLPATPGHIDRVARIEDALPGLPGVALAGSAYRGIGVRQCITQGQSAAERVLAAVGAPNRQSQIPSA